MIYKGTITIVGKSDDPLPVNCEVTDHRLVIKTSDGSVIGDWGLGEIGVESTRTGVILDAEGERLVVATRDIDAFARALEAPGPPRATDQIPKTRQQPVSESSARNTTRPVQPWHGTKRCVTGARIPKANRVMGRPCPYCGNTLGAPVGSTATQGSTTQEKLTRLQGLRDDGLVTDQEYQERRTGILDEVVTTGPALQAPSSVPLTADQLRRTKSRYLPIWIVA